MKKIIFIIAALLTGLVLQSCSEDKPGAESIFVDPQVEANEFDIWLENNYRVPYNISYKYKYEDIESDLTYDLAPADYTLAVRLAKIVKFLWLEAYEEAKDVQFVRTYVPREILLIGSVAYESNNTYRLGTAEGGLKITLYAVNWLEDWVVIDYPDPADPDYYTVSINIDRINYYFLNTIHHEFGHILHQTKSYPSEFKVISSGNYSPAAWFNRTNAQAAQLGFVSPYAGSQANDDFVETLSRYLTSSESEWQSLLNTAGQAAPIIEQKLQIVKNYMRDSWDIDLDFLKEVLIRRYNEMYDLDWVNI
ncbi:MAG: putative zinc-binding metallopeptidase [Rikenellaceae bacterium]|nr:putative zinc-binding metallopeptidase [Rikenellaceae bacterium]